MRGLTEDGGSLGIDNRGTQSYAASERTGGWPKPKQIKEIKTEKVVGEAVVSLKCST